MRINSILKKTYDNGVKYEAKMTEIFILFLEKMDECRKSHFNDYSFNQTSLEQIFINFLYFPILYFVGLAEFLTNVYETIWQRKNSDTDSNDNIS
ncbi:hypothetical protein H8356DRAFT_1363414 [Neocallimastix lanati (nom. inval.)]|nr:hypothetical protein H8356DRAFT_1363414 [Neocallimastix sp. JGI-2020a]